MMDVVLDGAAPAVAVEEQIRCFVARRVGTLAMPGWSS